MLNIQTSFILFAAAFMAGAAYFRAVQASRAAVLQLALSRAAKLQLALR